MTKVKVEVSITPKNGLVYTITVPEDVILNIAEGSQDLERIMELEKSSSVANQILALYFYLGYCEDDFEMAKSKINLNTSGSKWQTSWIPGPVQPANYSLVTSFRSPITYNYDSCPNCKAKFLIMQFNSGQHCPYCNNLLP